jgi:hypothetical protein
MGGYHYEVFFIIPAGLVGITCFGDFSSASDWPSINGSA